MIKSIVVSKKPFTFNIGDVYYSGNARFLVRHTVMGPPEKADRCWRVPVVSMKYGEAHIREPWLWGRFGEERQDYLYLGDEGVPGYMYDKRPCTLARTPLMAVQQDQEYSNWLKRPQRLKSLNADYE